MSVRLAPAVALLCTLWGGGGWVRADEVQPGEPIPETPDQKVRRPVAVIELSDTDAGRSLARVLGGELNNSDELRPLDFSTRQATLTDPVKDEDAEALDDARLKKELAENQVSDFKFAAARGNAQAGLDELKHATPTPSMIALYTQLTFALGAAKLGESKSKEADLEFRLAHTLDPGFKPDGIRYLPDFLQAYEAAIKVPQPAAKIGVTGTGRVFLDGRDTGEEVHDSRQTFDVKAGKHVIWLVGSERAPVAREVSFVGGERKEELAIELVALDETKRIKRRKLALKQAPDPAARAAAMQDLAALLEVKDAVLLTQANNKLIVQTWVVEAVTKDRAPGFSALREFNIEKDKPTDVLAPLIKPKKAAPPKKKDPPPLPPPITHDDRHWWQKRKWQAAIGVGAVVIGGVIYGLSQWDRTVGVDPNPGFPGTGRQ